VNVRSEFWSLPGSGGRSFPCTPRHSVTAPSARAKSPSRVELNATTKTIALAVPKPYKCRRRRAFVSSGDARALGSNGVRSYISTPCMSFSDAVVRRDRRRTVTNYRVLDKLPGVGPTTGCWTTVLSTPAAPTFCIRLYNTCISFVSAYQLVSDVPYGQTI